MTAIIRAELTRLVRRRTMAFAIAASMLFAVVATVVVFTGAPASGPLGPQGGTTLERLAQPGGGTEAFATAASFVGFFIFVTFIAMIGTESRAGPSGPSSCATRPACRSSPASSPGSLRSPPAWWPWPK
jgi:hypothetical protein